MERITSTVKGLWNGFLDGVFPRHVHCAACDVALGETFWDNLCPSCSEGLYRVVGRTCRTCGRYIGPGSVQDRCLHCLRDAVHLDGGTACTIYNDAAQALIHHLKYHNKPWLAHTMALHMAPGVEALMAKQLTDCIVPVPIHPTRLKERGYNQAEQLARMLSERLGVPVDSSILRRLRDTAPQNQLGEFERRRNTKGAFGTAPGTSLEGISVLLVDDVLTTGSTLNGCAETLKASGALRVVSAVYAAVPD